MGNDTTAAADSRWTHSAEASALMAVVQSALRDLLAAEFAADAERAAARLEAEYAAARLSDEADAQ